MVVSKISLFNYFVLNKVEKKNQNPNRKKITLQLSKGRNLFAGHLMRSTWNQSVGPSSSCHVPIRYYFFFYNKLVALFLRAFIYNLSTPKIRKRLLSFPTKFLSGEKMLHVFFAVAFSAAPLILYIPPIRSLNFFVQTIEDLLRESSVHSGRLYPRLRHACSRILNCMLCNNSR